ncbi:hypothetical protein DFR70_12571 [Nocardia tenerifensis]|uniref:Uncharacterized protein n=1 Tax=Nocardia tenerifensis TaxID=228006 RepID=A0A318JRK5_9NOCA|nr:hypothetical protein [Nocardia tenerifensis]PXX54090.1 hypothetical protein DFR70_12571 [Nocardia tenerifensis]
MPRTIRFLLLWSVPPLLIGAYWLLWAVVAPGFGRQNSVRAWVFNVVLHGSGLWWVVIYYVVGLTVYCARVYRDRPKGHAVHRAVAVGGALLFVVTLSVPIFFAVNLDKNEGRFYAGATTFYARDPGRVPSSLHLLADGGTKNSGGCAIRGGHDVYGCVEQGDLSPAGWEPRVGSLDGATIALGRAIGDVQAVSLRPETITYLNGRGGTLGSWSGVLDGSGITVSLGGVAEWTGEGNVTACTFTGDYAIDRAFGGARMNSLTNLLRERFPLIGFEMSDVWGYCDGKQPVVVIPVTTPIPWTHRTVDAPAGVIIVRGDHGHVSTDYRADVAAGTLPGPVYPKSLVARQRTETKWAAGRENLNRNHFGFDPAHSQAQSGNVAEYLLRDKRTGRLQWVTPMTLRGSTSELFVAYSVTPADEVHRRELNPQSVFVFDDTDPRRINIDNLDADARSWLATNAGTVMSNGGKLVEFTPIDGDTWRGFVEFNGRVAYRIDISATHKIPVQLTELDATGQTQPAQPAASRNADCGKVLGSLTPAQLTQCAKVFVDELANRQPPPR